MHQWPWEIQPSGSQLWNVRLIEETTLPSDFDMVVIDELSSFKNHHSKRFRTLMKRRPMISRIVGLTGTPTSNGLIDLWAQFKLLDKGVRLGSFIGAYQDTSDAPVTNRYIIRK